MSNEQLLLLQTRQLSLSPFGLDAKLFSFLWNVKSNSKSNYNYSLLITHY